MPFRCQDAGFASDTGAPRRVVDVPQAAVSAVACVGLCCAAAQLTLFAAVPRLRRAHSRQVLALIAAADLLGCGWWLGFSPSVLHGGAGGAGYPTASACRGGELLLLASEAAAGWWTLLLCVYACVWAHHHDALRGTRKPRAASRGPSAALVAAGAVLPVAELIAPAVWAAGGWGGCPISHDQWHSFSPIFHAHAALFLACLAASAAAAAATWLRFRGRRAGVPRLLLLPLTCVLGRGLGPLIWAHGWFRESCGDGWLAAWALSSPLHAAAHMLLFAANPHTLRQLRLHCGEAAVKEPGAGDGLLNGCAEDSPPPAEDEVDVLWGNKGDQVEFVRPPRCSPAGGGAGGAEEQPPPSDRTHSGTLACSRTTILTTHLGCSQPLSDTGLMSSARTPSLRPHGATPSLGAAASAVSALNHSPARALRASPLNVNSPTPQQASPRTPRAAAQPAGRPPPRATNHSPAVQQQPPWEKQQQHAQRGVSGDSSPGSSWVAPQVGQLGGVNVGSSSAVDATPPCLPAIHLAV